MRYITIGNLLVQMRREKKGITRKKLSDGLCSAQMLYQIEKDQFETDPLMIDMLLQRLGKSPDKLERILQADMYRMVRVRDLLEKTIYNGTIPCANECRSNVSVPYESQSLIPH